MPNLGLSLSYTCGLLSPFLRSAMKDLRYEDPLNHRGGVSS